MIKKKLVLLIYICLLAVFSAYPFSAHAQQEMSREERIKALELLKKEENTPQQRSIPIALFCSFFENCFAYRHAFLSVLLILTLSGNSAPRPLC